MTQHHIEVRRGDYADSVTLLHISRAVSAEPGVDAAMVAMATPLNLELLADMGFDPPDAGPSDLVVAVRLTGDGGGAVGGDAEDHGAGGGSLPQALATVDAQLTAARRGAKPIGAAETAPPRTTRSALREADAVRRGGDTSRRGTDAALSGNDAALALVSVPGAHAFVEAMDAVVTGHDVMVFSDNVPIEQEIRLKAEADRRDRLVMGPDCGTAVVDGVGLGFANAVRPGPVGIVAASGTGCQHLLSLLDAAGVGITAALGVGGRDLSDEVDGASTRRALRRLDADPATELIVVVSKPPAPRVADELAAFADGLATPVEFVLLGAGPSDRVGAGPSDRVGAGPSDLTAGAERGLAALDRSTPTWPRWGGSAARPRGGFLRGLFGGGTLCDEAMLIAADALGPVRSNIPLAPELALDSTLTADAHLMVDFGDDRLTAGRAHPMIDPTLRLEHLAAQAADPSTGVILLDVVLGHAAHPDPAAGLAPAVEAATHRKVPVIVSLVGTAHDPQGLEHQASRLADAGAEVFASNAAAARRAVSLIESEGTP